MAALGFIFRKFDEKVAELVDSFGCFRVTLATMHWVVAAERCALEEHVSVVKQEILSSTRVLVPTVGSLLRPCALREIDTEAGAFSFVLVDEGTRIMKFDLDMLLASLPDVVTERTRLGIVGDPCQVKATIRTPRCMDSLHVERGLGLSAVGWVLETLMAQGPTAKDFVDRVDLLNRKQVRKKC